MKKFMTITENELLNLAYGELLRLYLKEKENADRLPENAIAAARCERLRAKYEEVRSEILRQERKTKLSEIKARKP